MLHIQKEEGGECEHISFLADETDDPRPKFIQALKDSLGDTGNVLVYNQSFEKGVTNESATALEEFREWYDENIFQGSSMYGMFLEIFIIMTLSKRGSDSIKAVLPVMSDLSHKNLEINKRDMVS